MRNGIRLLAAPLAAGAVVLFAHFGGAHPGAAPAAQHVNAALAASVHARASTAPANPAAESTGSAGDTDNIQSGDQDSPDSGQSAATSGESGASETDGAGGFADPADANVDNQQQGQN